MVSRFGRRSHFIGFLRGLAWGSLLAAAVCLCQVVGFLPEIFDNRGAFWMMVKRYQGTLTDPNAFGMMAAIAAPLLIGLGIRRRRLWYYLAAMAVMTMGLWSGSRSFFLMLGLTAVLAGWAFRRTLSGGSPGSRRMMFGAVLLSGVVFVAALKSNSLPVGVQRLFATVDSSLSGEMLSSRAIYTKLALNVWSETSPVFGAGLGMFYRLQNAAADAVGINLKGWADNANNFYLQLLAEGGLAAVAMFIAAVLMFIRARSIDTSLVAVLLFALLLVLITGPHTNFNEVLVVFSVLLGFFVTLKPMRQSFFNRGSRWVAVLLMVVVVAGAFALSGGSSYGGSYGLYAPEGRGADRFRWSYARANVALDRNCQDKTLRLGSMKPDVATSPQRVRIREYGVNGQLMQEQSLRLGDHGEYLLEFGSEIRSVSLEVTPVWRPFDYGNPGDKRILGITLKGPTFKSCAD
jgi:O-antigen ligase